MDRKDEREVKKVVRQGYSSIARGNTSCCGPVDTPCCGDKGQDKARDLSRNIGYSEGELDSVPDGANLGLGCGNPVALASLREGETVIDLGSGPGLDCFLAVNRVGPRGRVIGIDMTHEMLDKARENAAKGDYHNVEFRLGEIEHLPVADNTADIVISNCVINLSPRKDQVFKEAFRVLRPGGRIMVSDIVLLRELPREVLDSVEAYVGCLSGAMLKDRYLRTIEDAGFSEIEVVSETEFPINYITSDDATKLVLERLDISKEMVRDISKTILSIKVRAFKRGIGVGKG